MPDTRVTAIKVDGPGIKQATPFIVQADTVAVIDGALVLYAGQDVNLALAPGRWHKAERVWLKQEKADDSSHRDADVAAAKPDAQPESLDARPPDPIA